jgi:hypothetical protein
MEQAPYVVTVTGAPTVVVAVTLDVAAAELIVTVVLLAVSRHVHTVPMIPEAC